MKEQFSFTLIEILIVLVVLIVTLAGGAAVWREKVSPTSPFLTPFPTPTLIPTPHLTPPLSSRLSPTSSPLATEIQYEDLDLSLTDCISPWDLFQPFEYREKKFIINSREDYQTLYNYRSPSDPCRDYTLPEIDFTQKRLLGKYTDGGGCSIGFVRKVYRDDLSKEIVCSIKVIEEGSCLKMRVSMNWVLVPKIPSDYTVRFEVQ